MKKFFLFATTILAAMAFTLTGCKDPEVEEPKPKPEPEPKELTFEVDVTAVTFNSVTYSVTPSIADADYLVVLVPETYIDNNGVGTGLTTAILNDLKNQAASSGKTLAEFLPDVMSKGTINEGKMENLSPATDYSLAVFGLDKDFKASTEPVCVPFTTEAVEMVDCTFETTVNVMGTMAEFQVVPSKTDIRWHMFIIGDSDYAAYTDPNGEYKFTDESLYSAYFSQEVNNFLSQGLTIEEVLAGLCPQGPQTMSAKGLTANTTYRYMIAGLLIDGEAAYMITAPSHDVFTSGDALASDMTFEIELSNPEMNRIDLKITPSTNETFTWICAPYDGVSTNLELMDKFIGENKMWLDWGMMLYTGVQDYTAAGPNFKYKVSAPDTDHYVMAVGYAGGVTTAPEVAFFRTLPAPAPEDAVFNIACQKADPWGAAVNVESSDETSYYTVGIALDGQLDIDAAAAEAEAGLQELYQMNAMFNPSMTMLDVLDSYYWSGSVTMAVTQLNPSSSYTMYVLVFSKEGKVVKSHVFEGAVITTAVGELTPAVEVIGYYSGAEENGELFGDAALTKDRAIAVVKYNNLDGATALYAFNTDPVSNPATLSSGEAYSKFWNYMVNVNLAAPYSFFLVEWTYDYITWATISDSKGNIGEFATATYTTTPEGKSDYAELKELVTALNSGSQNVLVQRDYEWDTIMQPIQSDYREIYRNDRSERIQFVPEAIARPMEVNVEIGKPELDMKSVRILTTPAIVRVR